MGVDWIDKNIKMPSMHPEFEDTTKTVLVTDGKKWGYGHYSYDRECWTYYLTNRAEQDDNKITHWGEPPILPKQN